MSNKYDEYLKTDYWKLVSDAVKKRADYRCQVCNSQHDLCAHHRTYDHRGQELNYLNDLVCLCRRCHEIFHGKNNETPSDNKKTFRSERIKKRLKQSISGVINSVAVESDMPTGDGDIQLDDDLIQKCRTIDGGYTSASLSALGVPYKPSSGWPKRLIGRRISRAEYRQALEGRYIFV